MCWFRRDHGTEYDLFGAGGGQELADQLEVPLLGQVPLVPALREGGDNGEPIVVADPDDPASGCSPRWPSISTSRWRPSASIEPSSRSSDG